MGTAYKLDDLDRKLLEALQRDASQNLDQLAAQIGSSKTPVWNRIQKMKRAGIITQQTLILNPEKIGLDACFFVLVRTSAHDAEWQKKFLAAIRNHKAVIEAHRLAGEIDYILKVQVKNARAYDEFYQSLIKDISIFNVSALLSMETIKVAGPLPILLADD